jgi:hypothetical protein
MRSNFLIGAVFLALSAGGCSYMAHYQDSYVATQIYELRAGTPGNALVVTDRLNDEKTFSVRPSSLTGSASTFKANLGRYVREMTLAALRRTFQGEVRHAAQLEGNADYRVAVTPQIHAFDYRYNQLKNLGLWITPESKISIRARVFDADGKQIKEAIYESGYVSGGGYVVDLQPAEKINQAVHQAMFAAVKQMVEDIVLTLSQQSESPQPQTTHMSN